MFKKINGGKLPTRGSEYSACVDLYAREDIVIGAGETKLVPLGVCIDFDKITKTLHLRSDRKYPEAKADLLEIFRNSHYLQLMPRSSLALKTGLIIANGVGIIDLDYEGEIGIVLHLAIDLTTIHSLSDNSNPCFIEIKKGRRIAQITLLEHKSYLFGIDTEDKRVGGFGSTDINSTLQVPSEFLGTAKTGMTAINGVKIDMNKRSLTEIEEE